MRFNSIVPDPLSLFLCRNSTCLGSIACYDETSVYTLLNLHSSAYNQLIDRLYIEQSYNGERI